MRSTMPPYFPFENTRLPAADSQRHSLCNLEESSMSTSQTHKRFVGCLPTVPEWVGTRQCESPPSCVEDDAGGHVHQVLYDSTQSAAAHRLTWHMSMTHAFLPHDAQRVENEDCQSEYQCVGVKLSAREPRPVSPRSGTPSPSAGNREGPFSPASAEA